MTDDIIVYDGGQLGPVVLIRVREGRASIVIEAGTRHLSLSPAWAVQAASGIDSAVARLGRDGRIKQITTPAGSAENGDAPPRPTAGRL